MFTNLMMIILLLLLLLIGVLKALAHMRDGLSAIQVLEEMYEVKVIPDKKHYAMAMFTAITSNQCSLAESIIAMYINHRGYIIYHQVVYSTVLICISIYLILYSFGYI